MKYSFALILLLSSTSIWARTVNDFNKLLIEDVQKDINSDNDQKLKTKIMPMRAPASVEASTEEAQEKIPFEKRNIRQTGSEKW